MDFRLMGAILVITGCGGFGFAIALNYRKEERALEKLIGVLEFMLCELEFRLSPLPDVFRKAAAMSDGCVSRVLQKLVEEMDRQVLPDAGDCMDAVLKRERDIPEHTRLALRDLGKSLGRFDLSGQLQEIRAVCACCTSQLQELRSHREERIRSYQTLGLCAGAALAILLI